jgi:methylenetetrahydrofolate reductase (NADPH)
MTSLSGAKLPPELERKLSKAEHDDALTHDVGVEWATTQCRELLEQGVPGIHFYTLNKSGATRHIFENLLAT